jgi:hypothetical protein
MQFVFCKLRSGNADITDIGPKPGGRLWTANLFVNLIAGDYDGIRFGLERMEKYICFVGLDTFSHL